MSVFAEKKHKMKKLRGSSAKINYLLRELNSMCDDFDNATYSFRSLADSSYKKSIYYQEQLMEKNRTIRNYRCFAVIIAIMVYFLVLG